MLIIGAVALVAVAIWYCWMRKPKAEEKTAKDEQPPVVKTAISAGGKRLIVPGYN